MLFSSWFWSHSVGHRSPARVSVSWILSPMVRRSRSSMEAISGLAPTGLGSSGWRRENASRRWVSAAARLAEVMAPVT